MDGAVMNVLAVIFISVALVTLLALAISILGEELDNYRNRTVRRRRRSIEAEWRIHRIGSDARTQMWDEASQRQQREV